MFDAGPTGDKVNSSKPPDIYSFDEDSSDALSPSSTSASPGESGGNETTSTPSGLNSPIQVHLELSQFLKHVLSLSALIPINLAGG